jgi:hypothetical protein
LNFSRALWRPSGQYGPSLHRVINETAFQKKKNLEIGADFDHDGAGSVVSIGILVVRGVFPLAMGSHQTPPDRDHSAPCAIPSYESTYVLRGSHVYPSCIPKSIAAPCDGEAEIGRGLLTAACSRAVGRHELLPEVPKLRRVHHHELDLPTGRRGAASHACAWPRDNEPWADRPGRSHRERIMTERLIQDNETPP